MRYYAKPLSKLISELGKLPGIGGKSAMRLAFHILSMSDKEVEDIANAIIQAKHDIKFYSIKGILKLYSQYGDKIIIIPVLCIILCMVTYFIHIITKKSKFLKYLPGLTFIIFGIFKFKSG